MMACHRRPSDAQTLQRGGIFFRLLFLIAFVCLCFLLYFARNPLLRVAGGFWVVDDSPQTSDAIVMLGDDNYNGDRASRAAQVFKAGWAPTIVVSGRYLRPYASIAELEEHDLLDRGVPQAAIVRFAHHAEDTREETTAIGQLIASHGWKRILLVTSNYHTRRSRYLAERTFPPGTVLHVVAAPDSDYDPRDWWHTRNGVKIFAHECVGILVSMWEMRHTEVQTSESSLISVGHSAVAGLYPGWTAPVYSRLPLYYSSSAP
jgi:uncharacterized SAM-binding protein YcdF (DUF218 family)